MFGVCPGLALALAAVSNATVLPRSRETLHGDAESRRPPSMIQRAIVRALCDTPLSSPLWFPSH